MEETKDIKNTETKSDSFENGLGFLISALKELLTETHSIDDSNFEERRKTIYEKIKNKAKDKVLVRQLGNVRYKKNYISAIEARIGYLALVNQGKEKTAEKVSMALYVKRIGLTLDKEKCIRCGISHTVCPKEAIALDAKNILVDEKKCVLCGLCVPFCPVDAIEMHVDGKKEDLLYNNESVPILNEPEEINGCSIRRFFTGSITVDESKCPSDCEECVIACPIDVIERDGKKVSVDKEKCVLCGACENSCPEDAIEIRRNKIITKGKKGFSASWTEVTEKLLGREKVNIETNAKSMDKMRSLVQDSELSEYTK
ncbi:MAG: 4Fe-4S binding protein [Nanoarchaeota archaeon]|nr:4Fe-4S binding protein [Nanoarchaeota archaeon]